MAARKILPFSTFTIFLTLLLLSSRIYCQDQGNDEDCDDGNTGPGKGPGSLPGKLPGSDPGKGPGSLPGKLPGSDPGKGPGSDLLEGLGSDILNGLDLGSIPGISDIVDGLLAYLDPDFLKSVIDYGGELVGMLTPILTAITDTIGTVLNDPTAFLSDPIPVLENLVKGILGPIAGVTKEVAIEIASEGGAITAQLSGILPEPLSGLIEGPIGDILNSVYVIGLDAADVVQGVADFDGDAILQSVGDIGNSVKTLITNLETLPNDILGAGV